MKKRYHIIRFSIAFLLAIFIFGSVLYYAASQQYIEPGVDVERVYLSRLSNNVNTLTWVTTESTGTFAIMRNQDYSIFNPNGYELLRVDSKQSTNSSINQIDIEGFEEGTYSIRVFSGLRFHHMDTVDLEYDEVSVVSPDFIAGRVVDEFGLGVSNVLVTAKSDSNYFTGISVENGTFAIDISGSQAEEFEVEYFVSGKDVQSLQVTRDFINPLPMVMLSESVDRQGSNSGNLDLTSSIYASSEKVNSQTCEAIGKVVCNGFCASSCNLVSDIEGGNELVAEESEDVGMKHFQSTVMVTQDTCSMDNNLVVVQGCSMEVSMDEFCSVKYNTQTPGSTCLELELVLNQEFEMKSFGDKALVTETFTNDDDVQMPESNILDLGVRDGEEIQPPNPNEQFEPGYYSIFDEEGVLVASKQLSSNDEGEVVVESYYDINQNGEYDLGEQKFGIPSNYDIVQLSSVEEYELIAGWNFINLPGSPAFETGSAVASGLIETLGAQGVVVEAVSKYIDGKFIHYAVDDLGGYSRDFEIVGFEPIFIKVSNARSVDITLSASYEFGEITLSPGWQTVGLTSEFTIDKLNRVLTQNGNTVFSVAKMENGSFTIVLIDDANIRGELFEIDPRLGYFVFTNTAVPIKVNLD